MYRDHYAKMETQKFGEVAALGFCLSVLGLYPEVLIAYCWHFAKGLHIVCFCF